MTPPTVMHWPASSGGGGSWTPSQLTSLHSWWDSQDLSALADGTTVTSWASTASSPNSRTFSAPSGAAEYETAFPSGSSIKVKSTGTSGFYINSTAGIATNVAGFSAFMVVRPQQSSVTEYLVVTRWSHNGKRFWIFGSGGTYGVTSHHGQSISGNDTSGNEVSVFGGTETSGTAAIVGGIADIGTALTISVDGSITQNTSFGTAGDNFSDVNPSRVGLAASNSFTSPPQDVDIAEVILVNSALSQADRQRVEGYLAHEWGLTANLPASHPYKSTAP